MTVLLLGNRAALQPPVTGDTDSKPVEVAGDQITTIVFAHGDYLAQLREIGEIVGPTKVDDPAAADAHFAGLNGPAWVESDDDALATIVAASYGCPVGRPADWATEQTLEQAVHQARNYGQEQTA